MLRLTKHAVLRYLERVAGITFPDEMPDAERYARCEALGLCTQSLREVVVPAEPRLRRALMVLGPGTYPVHPSHRIIVDGGVVTSVVSYS